MLRRLSSEARLRHDQTGRRYQNRHFWGADDVISDERIEELHELGIADAEGTGGDIYARIPDRSLTKDEADIYDAAFRGAFARMSSF